jgi:hypothetical protein
LPHQSENRVGRGSGSVATIALVTSRGRSAAKVGPDKSDARCEEAATETPGASSSEGAHPPARGCGFGVLDIIAVLRCERLENLRYSTGQGRARKTCVSSETGKSVREGRPRYETTSSSSVVRRARSRPYRLRLSTPR